MATIDNILEQLQEAANKPGKNIKKYKEEGKKIVGCFPVYTPDELVHAAGMVPFGVWGGYTELDLVKQYFPAFACSIMQSCFELGLKGVYNHLDAVIIPNMCDTLICLAQNWVYGVPHIKYIPLVHPQNRKIEAGVKYLMSEYENVKRKLEEVCGHEITEEAMQKSIDVYNEHRKVMREFVEVACKYPQIITPNKRHAVMKSGFFMLKEEHTAMVKQLVELLKAEPIKEWTGKTVLVSGIVFDMKQPLDVLEENNVAVVADDLAQETRQIRFDVEHEGKPAIERLARWWSDFEGCSLAYDKDKKRGDMIVEDVKKKGIDGVIFAQMKFCDPEEYDYPFIKKAVDDAEIPNLYIEVDQQTINNEQVTTRIQAFAELLS